MGLKTDFDISVFRTNVSCTKNMDIETTSPKVNKISN